jgi:hypothetical protein
MKTSWITVWALLLLVVLAGGASATDQPMADKIVGFWVSSSGTPIKIMYSGDPQKALLSINGGPNLDLWLATGARGGLSIDYTAPDGKPISGSYNENSDTISVSNSSGSFKATWRRRP